MKKGIIALDIDGTVCSSKGISGKTFDFLENLAKQGWDIAFITGRSFGGSVQSLSPLSVPYFLVTHNGSLLIEMPKKNLVSKKVVPCNVLHEVDDICKSHAVGFAIYGSDAFRDVVFWKQEYFSIETSNYLENRSYGKEEIWKDIHAYSDLPFSHFSCIRCFDAKEKLSKLAKDLREKMGFSVSIVKDPYHVEFYIALVTQTEADKGTALAELASMKKHKVPIIAAGDDENDISMLQRADIKIVMETAPKQMHQMATILAPSAEKEGIVEALEQAVKMV